MSRRRSAWRSGFGGGGVLLFRRGGRAFAALVEVVVSDFLLFVCSLMAVLKRFELFYDTFEAYLGMLSCWPLRRFHGYANRNGIGATVSHHIDYCTCFWGVSDYLR